MRTLRRAAAISLTLTLLGGPVHGQASFQPVTDAELRNPSDADWLQWRRTYDGWGYSPLDQIDRENVGSLTLAWSRALTEGSIQLIPLVHDGVIYITQPGGVVEALDATDGGLIWRYERVPPDGSQGRSTSRNIAIHGDRIFYAAPTDGSVVALDARTGEVVWETVVHDNQEDRAFHSSGPIVVKGKVLTGRSCQPGGLRGGCFIAAHDAETGEELWRAFTIARPGEPGGDTWGGLPLEDRYHVSTWMPGTYDPELDLVYWGTGVPGTLRGDISRGAEYGDLLYSNSTLALDPDTGDIVWYYQHLPGDEMDVDHVYERILVDVVVEPGPEVPSGRIQRSRRRGAQSPVDGREGGHPVRPGPGER